MRTCLWQKVWIWGLWRIRGPIFESSLVSLPCGVFQSGHVRTSVFLCRSKWTCEGVCYVLKRHERTSSLYRVHSPVWAGEVDVVRTCLWQKVWIWGLWRNRGPIIKSSLLSLPCGVFKVEMWGLSVFLCRSKWTCEDVCYVLKRHERTSLLYRVHSPVWAGEVDVVRTCL